MKPKRIEFDLGPNVHGQPVRLIWNSQGDSWQLHRDAISQRDDSAVVFGLTRDQLLKIGEAAQGLK